MVVSCLILMSASLPTFSFRATLYPCPETPQERKEMLAGVNARIEDLQMVNGLAHDAVLTHGEYMKPRNDKRGDL